MSLLPLSPKTKIKEFYWFDSFDWFDWLTNSTIEFRINNGTNHVFLL